MNMLLTLSLTLGLLASKPALANSAEQVCDTKGSVAKMACLDGVAIAERQSDVSLALRDCQIQAGSFKSVQDYCRTVISHNRIIEEIDAQGVADCEDLQNASYDTLACEEGVAIAFADRMNLVLKATAKKIRAAREQAAKKARAVRLDDSLAKQNGQYCEPASAGRSSRCY